jgi:hypothetical protein
MFGWKSQATFRGSALLRLGTFRVFAMLPGKNLQNRRPNLFAKTSSPGCDGAAKSVLPRTHGQRQ